MIHSQFSCRHGDLVIRGQEFRPNGENLPIAIVSHGFLANQKSTEGYTRFLGELGYAAYCFDFCGGGIDSESDGTLEDMTVLTEQEDLCCVINYVRELPYTDSRRLILMGCSQGGLVSALAAAALGEEVEKLILFYPALCIPDDARSGNMRMFQFDPVHVPDVIHGGELKLGGAYARSMQSVDVFESIKAFKGPVLLVHGTKDDVVSYQYSVKAQRIYKQAELLLLDGGEHGFKTEDDANALLAVANFLDGFKEMLTVDVELLGHTWTQNGEDSHLSLPFKGEAVGPFFHGIIEQPASDEQDYHLGKPVSMKADYFISGNNGRVHVINRSSGKGWSPKVSTEDGALSDFDLSECRTIADNRKQGPMIHIYATHKKMKSHAN